YRLYRFLTDVEDILETIKDDRQRLEQIRPLVRRLLTSSYWLQGEYREPNPDTGWSVLMLYDEPEFPLTVQTVVWLPGRVSPIHNHAAWGVVALISGEEKNTFWRRTRDSEFPDRIEKVGEQILVPGDIISFMPDAIHHVEVMGTEPTITFNLYGKTDYQQRFEFDPMTHTATNF
ncbi:MAG: cupin, partial [Coleofasciculus sp. C2-GNP5-27]